MPEFFAQLKRRRLDRAAAAYVVVAWVLLQLVNNVAPLLHLPDWVGTLFLIALVAGFPLALLFAWIHEFAAAGAGETRAAAHPIDWALIAALMVVIALISYQQFGGGTAKGRTAASATPPATEIAIAVLPFANMSGDAGQEFFSDGMTEEINAALTKIPDLHVVARTSAFAFKGRDSNVRAIGQALGATHLIEGSVRKAGNRVRVTADLVRADNGLNLWSAIYDRDLTDILAIQEDIARAIAGALNVPLGLSQGRTLIPSGTIDETAYEDYLRAKALLRSRSGGGLKRLVDTTRLLESVIAREPEFASAHALLACTYVAMPTFEASFLNGNTDRARPMIADWLRRAESAANRSVELAPRSAESHVALGSVEYARGRYARASEQLVQALALDPGNPDALHVYSGMLADLGYLSEAVRLRERLQTVDPLVAVYQNVTARILLATGQADAALAAVRQSAIPGTLAPIYAFQGRYAEAADVLASTPDQTEGRRERIEAAVKMLRSAPSPAISPDRLPSLGVDFFAYAYVSALSRALDWPEANLKIGYWGGATNAILWGRDFAPLRKTGRFKAFVRNAGMAEFWQQKGWPDLCHSLGAADFVCD